MKNLSNKIVQSILACIFILSYTNTNAQSCINTPDGITIVDIELPSGNCDLYIDLSIETPHAPKPKRLKFRIEYDSDGDGSIDASQEYTYKPGGSIPEGTYMLSEFPNSEEFYISNVDCNTVFTTTIIGYTSTNGNGGDCTTEIGYVDQNGFDTTLPISISTFEVITKEFENYIYWTTIEEKNNAVQILERSDNPENGFQEIGRFLSEGNTTDSRTYNLSDKTPLKISYYRIKSIDHDGTITNSKIIVAERKAANFKINNIYPVPVVSNATIQYNATKNSSLQLLIINAVGLIQGRIILDAKKGENSFEINMNDLSPGLYIISIEDGNQKVQKKIVKR